VGLLGQMGVSFGGEQIDFQDFSFNIVHITPKNGRLTLFGLGGLSKNRFRYTGEAAEIKQWKQFFDIDFESKTGVVGATFQQKLNPKSSLKLAMAFSEQQNDRTEKHRLLPLSRVDMLDDKRFSANATITHNWSGSFIFTGGLQVTDQQLRLNSPEYWDKPAIPYLLFQPWIQVRKSFFRDRLVAQAGLHGFMIPSTKLDRLTPRAWIYWRPSEKHRFCLSGGFQNSVEHLLLENATQNPAGALSFEAKYSLSPNPAWKLSVEYFYQFLDGLAYNFPEQAGFNYSIMQLNTNYDTYVRELSDIGQSKNMGIECSIQRKLTHNWFCNLNATLYKSSTENLHIVSNRTRWDLGKIVNLTMGREWRFSRNNYQKTRTLGINGRFVWSGGQLERSIDLKRSQEALSTVYISTSGYQNALPDYYRADLRIYWKRDIAYKRNSILALDIQNLTGRLNSAYTYYDPFTQQVEVKKQLGLIPNLSWRIVF
jgi:hypothetical protein